MNKKYFLPGTLAIFLMASCADEFNPEFNVEQPVDVAKLAELADFKPLKQYVDSAGHEGFKLGAAIEAKDFNSKLGVYNVAVTNFHEVVAGNAMKYASCVSDKGIMDFGEVNTFVNNAVEAGITVYGHTLAWHAQQQPKYLNSLLADKVLPVTPGEETWKEIWKNDMTQYDSFPYYVMGYSPEFSKEEGLISYNPTEWYQYFAGTGVALKEGTKYQLVATVKSDKDVRVAVQVRWSWGEDPLAAALSIPASEEWTEVKCTFDATTTNAHDLIFQPGVTDARFCIKELRVDQQEQGGGGGQIIMEKYYDNILTNSDMEGDNASCFTKKENNGALVTEITPGVGVNGSRGVSVLSKAGAAADWDSQFWITIPDQSNWIQEGQKIRVTFDYKASIPASADTQAHAAPGAYQHWACVGSPSFTTDWQTYVKEVTIDASMAGGNGLGSVAFNLSKDRANDVTYYFDNIKLEIEKERPAKIVVNYVDNSDMEGTDAHNFISRAGAGDEEKITDGVGVNGSRGIAITSKAGAAQDWDTQFFIKLNEFVPEGTQLNVVFDYKASIPASADTQAHGNPGAYQHWACVGSPSFTTEWQTYTKAVTIDASMAGAGGMGSIAFNLSKDRANDVTFYFDNIKVYTEKEQDVPTPTVPLTPEEKRDTLIWAMDRWIAGMMEACEGKVKAWDVVNEAISGGGSDPQVDGLYPLQHGTPENTSDFFWQDNMGDDVYVRTAVASARKYYAKSMAEQGGDDGKLKLFVNDYNLESWWDNNKKLESLIKWIEVWEADGVTKIDGIGSQMHISYNEKAEDQKSLEDHIVRMLELMAKSGKLCRISELDMGYNKADGTAAKLSEMTPEMEMKMDSFYKWIIEQYFAIIPQPQQYGITQWCLTDSPSGSGWRPDTPVGIWDLNWNRKYIYRGWAEALSK